MAPVAKSAAKRPDFEKDEKALCFHGELLYEAKVLELKQDDPKNPKSDWKYRVHYKGWKNTWDDWVPQDRLRKFSDENKELASNLKRELDAQRRDSRKTTTGSTKKKLNASDLSSQRASEDRSSSLQPNSRKRGRDWELEKEEAFMTRPSIRIPLSDHLKSILVDDWENVTKNLQLVPLPHHHPVSEVLDLYMEQEQVKRRPGSAEHDILEEVVKGVREYFDKSLGRILLYRFERQQWLDVYEKMHGTVRDSSGSAIHVGEDEEPDLSGKTPSEIYGSEHLCRLFVTMPELIAQTNMDAQSVNRLREELAKMTQWLGKNSTKFFVKEYENAGQEYVDKARGTG